MEVAGLSCAKLTSAPGQVEEKGKGELGVNNKSGETPLMVAVKEQQDEIVHFLVQVVNSKLHACVHH